MLVRERKTLPGIRRPWSLCSTGDAHLLEVEQRLRRLHCGVALLLGNTSSADVGPAVSLVWTTLENLLEEVAQLWASIFPSRGE